MHGSLFQAFLERRRFGSENKKERRKESERERKKERKAMDPQTSNIPILKTNISINYISVPTL
jgi:hypothetical protein